MPDACVLLSDITGSTQLYDRLSQRDALAQISYVLARMREIVEQNGGKCVKSQGDDTLNVFRHSHQGFAAARAMASEPWSHGLSIHAGLTFGEIIPEGGDIYGDAVNTSARLCSLAKPAETLISQAAYQGFEPTQKNECVGLGALSLKGKQLPTDTYSLILAANTEQTVITLMPRSARNATRVGLISFGDQEWRLNEGETLEIGRGADCDLVVPDAWVSRRHASFEMRGAQLEFTDKSASGSRVHPADGKDFVLHRRGTLLSGAGKVLLGIRDDGSAEPIIFFDTGQD